jgi:hypothetical protein
VIPASGRTGAQLPGCGGIRAGAAEPVAFVLVSADPSLLRLRSLLFCAFLVVEAKQTNQDG